MTDGEDRAGAVGGGSSGAASGDESDVPGETFVARVADLDRGERVLVDVEGVEVAVFNVGGEYHALVNYCVHQGGPACEGLVSGTLGVDDAFALTYERDGEILSCPWHGWEFDVTTGEHLAKSGLRLPRYEVVVRDGGLYVTR